MQKEDVIGTIIHGLNSLKSYCENHWIEKKTPEGSKNGIVLTPKEFADKYLFCSEGCVYDVLRDGSVKKYYVNGNLSANDNDVIASLIRKKGKRSFKAMKRHYKQRPEFKSKVDEVLLELNLANPFQDDKS